MKKWLWLSVVSVVLLGFFSAPAIGSGFWGESYFESVEFQNDYAYFTESLVRLQLDSPDAENMAPVTEMQIEEYRTRYGTLAEQISSVHDQYAPDIESALSAGNDSLAEALTEERDAKLKAIRANFADDEVVREKILDERSQALRELNWEYEAEREMFLDETSYYVYELKNEETGEVFRKGELSENPLFEQTYTSANPLHSQESVYYSGGYGDMAAADIPLSSAKFTGTVQVDKELFAASGKDEARTRYLFMKMSVNGLWLTAVAGLVLLLTKLKIRLSDYTDLALYKKWVKWPFEGRVGLALVSAALALITASTLFNTLTYTGSDDYWSYGINLLWKLTVSLFFIGATVLQLLFLIAFYRKDNFFLSDVSQSSAYRSLLAGRSAFLKKSVGLQMLALLVVVFFWGFGTMLLFMVPEGIVIWIPATLFIGLPVLVLMMKRFGYLNELMIRTEEMAAGSLSADIPVRGNSPLADHARQLIRLKEGVQVSMSEQAKSERLKTELITNVSHDLRTPLTSIITYTDLLKQPNLAEDSRLAYAEILDRKSQRLKTLIEDLFEVSKMASGNIELNRQNVDAGQLLRQALAEHAEEIDGSGLEFRVTVPEKPVRIYADGQKWWRMMDNLIINAMKYAMTGTRVYVSLQEKAGEAEFIIKNVTRHEIGGDIEELFERFKRGDTSRGTEGSGLGLAIAQSIVDLHGGSLKIEIDGDLFKVTVKLPVM